MDIRISGDQGVDIRISGDQEVGIGGSGVRLRKNLIFCYSDLLHPDILIS